MAYSDRQWAGKALLKMGGTEKATIESAGAKCMDTLPQGNEQVEFKYAISY